MLMTAKEFEDLYTGYKLAVIERKEERMELAKMISYASNVKKQDWLNAFGDTTKMKIIALGGEADMENRQVSEAKLNQRLTQMINRKKSSPMDDMERLYISQNSKNIATVGKD